MGLSKSFVKDALSAVTLPDGRPASEAMEWAAACDAFASVKMHIADLADPEQIDPIARSIHQAIRDAGDKTGELVASLTVEFVDHAGTVIHRSATGAEPPPEAKAKLGMQEEPKPESKSEAKPERQAVSLQQREQPKPKPSPQDSANPLPGVKHAIAVGAGKGGVGKSTVSVNLAVALARRGHSVGILDGDIYGPSLPTLLALDALDMNVSNGSIHPFRVHGVKAMTIGKMVDPEKPLIWRGPMAHGAFKQLTEQTEWGELDYLIIDLPPGTGDVPLTMAQTLQLTGAVVVCTPQKVAQDDAVRAVRMFQQLRIDVLGVVENMSYFVGDDGKEYDIFGRGGAEQMAQRLGLPFLGNVPINTSLRTNSDKGDPSANFEPKSAGGDALPDALERMASNLESQTALASLRQGTSKPTLSIS